MSTMNPAPSPDTPITIKLALNNSESKRFKLPLRDLGPSTFPDKLRSLLAVPPSQSVTFERFSDSAGQYIVLDSKNPSVYKQLYRAAKAKLKLRIKATINGSVPVAVEITQPNPSNTVSSSTSESKPSYGATGHQLQESSRSKLPYDPCASPSITPPRSLLDTANPMLKLNNPDDNEKSIDQQMELILLEQESKKRCLPSQQAASAFRCSLSPPLGSTQPGSLTQRLNASGAQFTICCNNCDATIPDIHWHCGICDNGDFDLCKDCVDKGFVCDSDEHWLIKRDVKNGQVVNSTTETAELKNRDKAELTDKVPGAFAAPEGKSKPTTSLADHLSSTRTCNACVGVFDETKFVTCHNCEDYDLCIPCHVAQRHGHDPRHAFSATSYKTTLDSKAESLCGPGRGIRHWAICDGCNLSITGVRHKCLNCPDWDFCAECVKNARTSHPGHRFMPLHEALPLAGHRTSITHYGINCDGPLCKEINTYIKGDRYKCAVCHDTDFCAKCEALPLNRHNRTHPLIKFKSPVRNVSVTTLGEKENGEVMCTMGDQLPQTMTSKATETNPVAPSANAATQVQTIAEVKPVEEMKEPPKESITKLDDLELQAHFIRDAVADGSVHPPSTRFEQVWTLRNPGPYAWPAGCSVRFIGGDAMFNVDPNHPSSVSDIVKAAESNVIDRVVAVGEEVDFTVMMRTPEREGKAISYWRLKAADGKPFGHKLWCDVDVRRPQAETPHGKDEDQPKVENVESAGAEQPVMEKEQESSRMIFPQLDKESPVSSSHEAQGSASAATASEEKELLEDVESMGLEDDDSTDDGFLTDEEYEMLNASDDEFAEAINGRK